MNRLTALAAAVLCLLQVAALPIAPPGGFFLYIGTQSTARGAGISVAYFDPDSGQLTTPQLAIAADGPSFFAAGPNLRLYTTDYTGTGGVGAYQIDANTGGLKLLNRIAGGNFGTSHISIDATGQYVLAANFDHGHIAVFPVHPDGSLAQPTFTDIHTGHGINPLRQKVTYPHCILLDGDNQFALVPDLGLDKLFVYHFDPKTGQLKAGDPPYAEVLPGSGPRHVAYHPNGRWVYLLNEMASRIDVFNFGLYSGHLSQTQSVSMLADTFHGENTAAEIAVHPNGHYLYASNRGEDTIVVFAIDPVDGTLKLIERVPSQGKAPRDFVLDPRGEWLICTNQKSDNAVVFRIDPATGLLTAFGKPVSVPAPCGLKMVFHPVVAAQPAQ